MRFEKFLVYIGKNPKSAAIISNAPKNTKKDKKKGETNMKRMTAIMIVVCMLLCGCNTNITESRENADQETNEASVEYTKVYDAYIYGFSDSGSNIVHTIEYEFADKSESDKVKPAEKLDITVNEIKFSGAYKQKQYLSYNYFPVYKYEDNDHNEVSVDEDGKIVFCFFGESASLDKKITEAESIAIAKRFLETIVDVSQYSITVSEDTKGKTYEVAFTKHVGELETTDCAYVMVKYSGEIYSYSSFMLGKIRADVKTDDINITDVVSSVKYKLNSIYKEASDKYDKIEYEEPTIKLTLLKNGKRGLISSSEVKLIDIVGEYSTVVSEKINMVLFVD